MLNSFACSTFESPEFTLFTLSVASETPAIARVEHNTKMFFLSNIVFPPFEIYSTICGAKNPDFFISNYSNKYAKQNEVKLFAFLRSHSSAIQC
jgi:hypothetical protein